jgi:Domain of unknown function (DUF222)
MGRCSPERWPFRGSETVGGHSYGEVMSAAPTGPAPHPVLAAVAAAREGLAAAAGASMWSCTDAEVTTAVEDMLAAAAQLEALTAAAVGEADARMLARDLNAVDTRGWLRRRFQLSSREASRRERLAQALPVHPRVAEGLAAGAVSAEQAETVVRVLERLPVDVSAGDRERAEALLVEQAATLDPDELAHCGRQLAELLTTRPDSDDPAEAAEVEREANRQAAAQHLRSRRRGDGTVAITAVFEALCGAELLAVLEAHAAPLPDDDGVTDERSKPTRLADALHEIVTAAGAPVAGVDASRVGDDRDHSADFEFSSYRDHSDDSDDSDDSDVSEDRDNGAGRDADAPSSRPTPGSNGRRGVPAQVSLLVRWETLQAMRPRAGMLEDGTDVSPNQVLRALCAAGVLPLVFRGPSRPMHLGRRRRLFTPAQHAVLAARDRGCAFPSCTRAPAACTAHHMRHWAEGGPTDVGNGCLLCAHHHALVHREGWATRLARNGYPEFVPPPAYDPHRRPRQHLRFRGPDGDLAGPPAA